MQSCTRQHRNVEAQVLHDLWINEGYTSPAFLAATNATFPTAATEARQLACIWTLHSVQDGLG